MTQPALQFHGFHPSDFTRSYLEERIDELQKEAPYGANVKAVFSRKDHIFKGVVTIYSSVGRFFAVSSGRRVKEVSHGLVEQIRRQLNKWKSQRFHETDTVA